MARELALAAEHPRGTELRRLGPYKEALRSPAAYAALPESDRDVIVRWAEVRRRLRDEIGLDRDPENLADPLIPAERLRSLVIEGERSLARPAHIDDPGGDVVELVGRLRGAPR